MSILAFSIIAQTTLPSPSDVSSQWTPLAVMQIIGLIGTTVLSILGYLKAQQASSSDQSSTAAVQQTLNRMNQTTSTLQSAVTAIAVATPSPSSSPPPSNEPRTLLVQQLPTPQPSPPLTELTPQTASQAQQPISTFATPSPSSTGLAATPFFSRKTAAPASPTAGTALLSQSQVASQTAPQAAPSGVPVKLNGAEGVFLTNDQYQQYRQLFSNQKQ